MMRDDVQRDVEFLSGPLKLRGWLWLPSNRTGARPPPLVILAHGLGGLKEWTIPDVAAAFVDAGIAALAFDYRNFGDSEGEPREEVDHTGRINDWQNAITYATTLPDIDVERIGVWGTSLGGRDVLALAAIDSRVRCVVSQVPLIKWETAFGSWLAGYGDDIDTFHHDLADDLRDRALGKKPRYISFETPQSDTGDTGDREYQRTWGEKERRNYKGHVTLQTYRPNVLLDVTPMMPLIAPTPLLFLIADQDILPGQREAFEAARGLKTLVILPGHHYSLYTTAKAEAITSARDWFVKHLKA